MSAPTDLDRLQLGTAPDSWGVWFPQDPYQVSWQQYLDEVARAGYVWTELGPSGFLPQDPEQLRDELGRRGLQLCGGTVFAGLHRGKEALDTAIEAFGKEARLLTALGAKHLVHLPEQYTDMHTGAATEAAELDQEHWTNLVTGTNELGRVMHEQYGVELVFHPHVDTHVDTQDRVERFLTDTDPRYVNLCLDTGHISYCGGDNVAIISASRSGSATCTSSRSTPRCSNGCGRRSCRSPTPSSSARWSSRRTGSPRCRRCSTRSRTSAPTSSPSSSRTSTRSSPDVPLPHRRPHRGLLRRLRTRPRPALALPALTSPGRTSPVTVNVGVIGVGMIGQDHIRIGAPLLMHAAHRNPSVPPTFTGDMIVVDSAVHDMDVARWMFDDEIAAVSVLKPKASSKAGEGENDLLIVLLEMASGVLVDVEVFVNASYGYDIRGEVVCEDGTAELSESAGAIVKGAGRYAGRVPVDWRERFVRAFDTEFQEWINAVAVGSSTGPSAWDGYAATVGTDTGLEALRTGTRVPVRMRERPDLYKGR
jgi:Sugar phosphate isomerases/epimerases